MPIQRPQDNPVPAPKQEEAENKKPTYKIRKSRSVRTWLPEIWKELSEIQ